MDNMYMSWLMQLGLGEEKSLLVFRVCAVLGIYLIAIIVDRVCLFIENTGKMCYIIKKQLDSAPFAAVAPERMYQKLWKKTAPHVLTS